MAKDIKIYKGENEMVINETQLDNFIDLGWKQEKEDYKTQKFKSFKNKKEEKGE